jgi:hypothetical protein
MARAIEITDDDINNLATKLDELAGSLSPREIAVLHAMIELAGDAISRVAAATGEDREDVEYGEDDEDVPAPDVRLSDGFRDAFARGTGTRFVIASSTGERAFQVLNVG